MNAAAPMNPRLAEETLRNLGVDCRVEVQGTLAVVIPVAGARALEDVAVRRAVVAALRAHGFTHTAVEVTEEWARVSESDAPRQ